MAYTAKVAFSYVGGIYPVTPTCAGPLLAPGVAAPVDSATVALAGSSDKGRGGALSNDVLVALLLCTALAACGTQSSNGGSDGGGVVPQVDGGGVVAQVDGGAAVDSATFVAFGSSDSTVNLLWTPAAGATGYKLERETSGASYAEVKALDASATTYLDSGLASQTAYGYRLTAIGATADAVREHGASTTDVAVLQTTTDVPVGVPVQQSVGSQGGTVATADGAMLVIVPAGALPDGATVTLQQVASPLSLEQSPALAVSSDSPFAKDVTIAFKLGEDDPDLVGLGLQDADGFWFTAPSTADATAGTVSATLPAATLAKAPSRGLASAARSRKAMRFRRIYVTPPESGVRAGTQLTLTANALFTEDTCGSSANPDACGILMAAADIATHGDVGALSRALVMPLPKSTTKPVQNSTGVWSLEPAGGASGTLVASQQGGTALYTAPSSAPPSQPVKARFTLNPRAGKPAVPSDPALIRFLGSTYQVRADFDATGYGINEAVLSHVTDTIKFDLAVSLNPAGNQIVTVSSIQNLPSSHGDDMKLDPTADSFVVGCCFELITVDSMVAAFGRGSLTLQGDGTTSDAPVTLNYPGGVVVSFPGGSGPSIVTLDVAVDLLSLTGTVTLPTTPPTGWKVTIVPGP